SDRAGTCAVVMPDAISTLWYCSAVAGLTESARKTVVSLRVGHELSRDYLAAGLALVALSVAAGAPSTRLWAEHVIGTGNVAFVVGLGAATVAANVSEGMRATSVGEACGLLLFVIGCAFAAAMRHAHERASRARDARQIAAVEQLWRLLEPVRADAVTVHGEG